MHELAITDAIVAGVCERIGAVRVLRVTVEIGQLTAIVPDAVRFCFDTCALGTALEGAALDIVQVPGRARCRECHTEFETQDVVPMCGCGALAPDILSGLELQVRSVEVE